MLVDVGDRISDYESQTSDVRRPMSPFDLFGDCLIAVLEKDRVPGFADDRCLLSLGEEFDNMIPQRASPRSALRRNDWCGRCITVDTDDRSFDLRIRSRSTLAIQQDDGANRHILDPTGGDELAFEGPSRDKRLIDTRYDLRPILPSLIPTRGTSIGTRIGSFMQDTLPAGRRAFDDECWLTQH